MDVHRFSLFPPPTWGQRKERMMLAKADLPTGFRNQFTSWMPTNRMHFVSSPAVAERLASDLARFSAGQKRVVRRIPKAVM